MEHDNVQARKKTEPVNGGEIICWFRHFKENLEKTGRFPLVPVKRGQVGGNDKSFEASLAIQYGDFAQMEGVF